LDKELQTYCENYFALFRMDGFQTLLKELRDQVENINSVEYTRDANDLFFRKGQLNVIAYMLNLEQTINRIYEEAQNGPEG